MRKECLSHDTHLRSKVREEVTPIHMKEGSVHNRTGQIQCKPTVRVKLYIEGDKLWTFVGEQGTGAIICEESMSIPRELHVKVSPKRESNWASRNLRSNRRSQGRKHRSRFFSTKSSTQTLDTNNNLRSMGTSRKRRILLGFRCCLSRAINS